MITPEVDNFSYLWNGTAPEWHLRRLPRQTEALMLFKDGITAKDILKIKNIAPEYALISTAELLSRLKGMAVLNLGVVNENAAINLESKCKQVGIEFRLVDIGERYVIANNERNCILAIEDNDVYREVKDRMLKAGVTVLPSE